MKVSISLEKTITDDVSIMVDALRASSTITLALDKFKEIIPCSTKKEAIKFASEIGGVLAGEREGKKIEGFDIGNSPREFEKLKTDCDTLILTTGNGTRVLKDMNSTVLVGAFVNAKAVANYAIQLANNEIDVVMAGYKGNFTIEDFLASGEIVFWILKELDSKEINYEVNDLALAGILASRDKTKVKETIYKSRAAKKLEKLDALEDIEICLNTNISENVAIYKDKKLRFI